MYFDAITATALVDELHDKVVGGRVQKILDVSEHEVGLEVYLSGQRHYLLLSADPQQPRLQLLPEKLRRGLPKPTQVGLLLRRLVEGAYLEDVTQPEWERVITLRFEGREGDTDLIVEAMERRANVLLVRGGTILDCIRRVGPDENRVRLSLPGHEYVPPPPQAGKLPPDLLTVEDIGAYLDNHPGTNAWRTLTRRIMGLSPLLGRELVFRATGRPNAKAADTPARAVYEALQTLLPPLLDHDWQPGIGYNEDGSIKAFAVYPLTSVATWTRSESISAAMLAYYGAPVGEAAYDNAKEPVQAQLNEAIKRVQGKVDSMERGLRSEAELEHLRHSGELLLAYQYTLSPGATEFEAQYDPEGDPLHIKLDPALTPLENAQAYFDKYDRAKRAAAGVPQMLEVAQQELAFLRQLEADLTLATNWPEIDEVQAALQQEGYWRGPKRAQPRGQTSGPLRLDLDGFTVWVGRNARQNNQVTFDKAGPDDLWIHVRDLPGAHIIVRTEGRAVPDAVIEQAMQIAAYFSPARGDTSAQVDVTERRHVKKIKGGKPGMVTYRNERTWTVQPQEPEDEG